MKSTVFTVLLVVALTTCAWAQDDGRYRFYTIKSGNHDLAFMVDSATGRAWQVQVDASGKVTQLSAITVEGIAYASKDAGQLYSKVQSADIDGLSTSNSATKIELEQLYGYGLDAQKLTMIRDKVKAATTNRR